MNAVKPSGIFTLLCLDEPDLVTALADFGRHELGGHHPWATAAPDPAEGPDPLADLRIALDVVRPHCGSFNLLRNSYLKLAGASAWAAVGTWRFIAYAGPSTLRDEPQVREQFLIRLREVVEDSGRPRYLADAVEESLIRAGEPRGGPLWRIVPVRPADLVERTPPAPGSEPPLVPLAPDERRHLATIHRHRLVATLAQDGGHVALATPVRMASATAEDAFACADSLPALLRALAQRIGFDGAADWVHDDLRPYFTRALPDWWPR